MELKFNQILIGPADFDPNFIFIETENAGFVFPMPVISILHKTENNNHVLTIKTPNQEFDFPIEYKSGIEFLELMMAKLTRKQNVESKIGFNLKGTEND